MMPGIGVVRGVPNHRNLEEQIERQMGCMTGFIQLFDRQQILTGKRFYSAKRLPSSLHVAGSASPSEKSEISTFSVFKEVPEYLFSPSPDGSTSSLENDLPTNFPARHTLPLPVFEGKDGVKSSWKLREAPRLSLDSRANVDAKGKLRPREIQTTPMAFTSNLSEASEGGDNQEKQRRSPSVVARLMGLEELPIEEAPKRPELRRSASESRAYRDLSPFDSQNPFPISSEEGFRLQKQDYQSMKSPDTKPEPPRLTPSLFQRRSFEAQEFFPEPKRLGSLYGELEKRLRMRGIQEPARDLETLKQILEALQLKGLLHSKQTEHHEAAHLNNFHDRRPHSAAIQPPIVVMKPVPKTPTRLAGSELPTLPSRSIPPRRLPMQEPIPPARVRRDRLELDRNFLSAGRQSPTMPEPSLPPRTPSDPPKRRRPLKDEGKSSPLPQRRVPPAQSPKSSPKRLGSGQSGPPKTRRQTAHIPPKDVYSTAEDDTSTVSDMSTTSQFEFERAINEDYRSGRSLLERCDKLLHSIAAITSSAEQVIPTDRQLSPVSVLDSSIHSDESSTSSLPKRAIGFNDKITEWHGEHAEYMGSTGTISRNQPLDLTIFLGPPTLNRLWITIIISLMTMPSFSTFSTNPTSTVAAATTTHSPPLKTATAPPPRRRSTAVLSLTQ
ncbi:Protein LONGIFOLIA 1 [Dendrobium catenatum]|uniref:Protein LONGIFOLIA 1 n=1 Tax=Dendrobium catenatum TaxID=906689 RepID=A0A2I0XBK6_9ASPA|nr:Protein LONGIFOLIA 1 [Dendrobium catenatum]